MKKSSLILGISFMLVLLSACGNKEVEVAETTVVEENHTKETQEENTHIDISIGTELDISSLVREVAEGYDEWREFALTHGVIYTDGTKTNGPILMDEITPYEPGDAILESEMVSVAEGQEEELAYESVDYDTFYDIVKDMTEVELHYYIYINCNFGADWIEAAVAEEDLEGLSEEEAWRLDNEEIIKVNGGMTLEEWSALSLEEMREATARMKVTSNEKYNAHVDEENAEVREHNAGLSSYQIKAPKGAGSDYISWYKANRLYLIRLENTDFTVGKVLPDYIKELNGSYVISQEDIRDLYKAQGEPEDKVIEIEVYGYKCDYDVSNVDF